MVLYPNKLPESERVCSGICISIIELVREIRLTKAIQIMCEGNHSMAEIASKVGFLNQSYFTASFKKKYNMTPTQYIKQLKNETNKS